MSTPDDESLTNRSARKAYLKPTLRRHGRLARITAGGSGTMQEMAMMMMALARFP